MADLGRYQLGQVVTPGIATVSGGNPAAPDAAPTATFTFPDSTTYVETLAMDGGPTAWALPVFLGVAYPLGTYTVSYSYAVAGVAGSGSDTFEVIAGGDPGGRVISMAYYSRPEAGYIVAQLASGRLVQGKNPVLPTP